MGRFYKWFVVLGLGLDYVYLLYRYINNNTSFPNNFRNIWFPKYIKLFVGTSAYMMQQWLPQEWLVLIAQIESSFS